MLQATDINSNILTVNNKAYCLSCVRVQFKLCVTVLRNVTCNIVGFLCMNHII